MLRLVSRKKKPKKRRDESPRDDATFSARWIVEGPVALSEEDTRVEIVRQSSGRFGWIFVRIDDRGRRVLARSERSYRSRKRVRRAIAVLEDASIVDATKEHPPVDPAPDLRSKQADAPPGIE
jgi:hypothetical protein